MNKKVLMVLMSAVALLLLAGATAAFSGDGFQPVQPDRVDKSANNVVGSEPVSALQAAETTAYWTKERLEAAQPLDLLMLDEADRQPMSVEAVQPDGAAGFVEGGMPDADAEAWARAMFPDEWAAIDAATDDTDLLADPAEFSLMADGYTYPFPFNQAYYVPWKLKNDYPHSAIGRLFFTIPGLGNYSCSASVMVNRALWTAGHCVYTGGRGWHTNVVFVPAYRNGSAPYGVWSANQLFALGGWVNGNIAYDIGSVILNDLGGKTVAQTTGWLGASWNATAKRHWHSFGYPGNIAGGKVAVTCQGSLARRDPISNGPDPIAFGCNMGGGSSGGPVIFKYAPTFSSSRNFVNGVNSYGYTGQPNGMYFSYFGAGAANLYDASKTK